MKVETEYWWAKTGQTHELIYDTVENLREEQSWRSDDNLYHLRLYGNIAPSTLGSLSGTV